MELLTAFVDRWKLRPVEAACFEQLYPWPCTHKYMMYHVVGNLLSLLIGIDPFTLLWLGTFFVIEYALENWTSPISGIVAVTVTVVGLIVGTITRRVYGITTVTSHYMYDIPAFDDVRMVMKKKSKPLLWGIYFLYTLVGLLPMVAFFMCDVRIDTDVVSVSGKYILHQCLDVRRYVLTEYYPLGMAMTGIIYGALVIVYIVFETRYLLYAAVRMQGDISRAIYFRTFHTIIVYGGTLYQVVVYILLSMLLKVDIFWLYVVTLLIWIITMLAFRGVFLFAATRITGIWKLPTELFMKFWPCVRSIENAKTAPTIPETLKLDQHHQVSTEKRTV